MRSTAKSRTGRWSALTDKELHEAQGNPNFWPCFAGVLEAKLILALGVKGLGKIREAEELVTKYFKVER